MVEVKDASDVASLKTGEQVFAAQCTACHTAGALGAPKLGDAAAWGAAHQDRLRRAASLGARRQGPDAAAGRRRLQRFRDRPRRRLHGQQGRRQVRRAGSAGRRGLGAAATTRPRSVAAPAADANAGTPIATATAALNAQVRDAAPTQRRATRRPVGGRGDRGAAAPPLYAQTCSVCHATGVAGAPKLGDKAAWAPRLAQGIDGLTASAIKGKGAMPPRAARARATPTSRRSSPTWSAAAK